MSIAPPVVAVALLAALISLEARWSPPQERTLVEHTFLISNAGDAPLVISRIVATGNVELSTRQAEIAPGGKLELVAKTALLRERALDLIIGQAEIEEVAEA